MCDTSSCVRSDFHLTLPREERHWHQLGGMIFSMQHEILSTRQAKPPYRPFGESPRLVGVSYKPTRYAVTHELPVGAQARLMQAAEFSQALGHPVNAVLTINAAHLQRIGEGGIFSIGHLWDGFQNLLELVRKWLSARGVFWAVIWSREWSRSGHRGQAGEHWHIGLHLLKHLHQPFAEQVAHWTGEPLGSRALSEREAAVSVAGAWHLSVQSGRGGPASVGAYLGKAEPGRIIRYGKRMPNERKPRRNKYGGTGPVEGKRYGICKTLGATEQARSASDAAPRHGIRKMMASRIRS